MERNRIEVTEAVKASFNLGNEWVQVEILNISTTIALDIKAYEDPATGTTPIGHGDTTG